MSRQDWRTPPSVFRLLNDRWGPFDIDAASDGMNSLCREYRTPRDGPPWSVSWYGRVFVNPPFGDMGPWVDKAIEHPGTVMLAPNCPCSPWFRKAIGAAALYLPNRRIHFWHPAEEPGSPDRDTVIFVFGLGPNVVREIEIPDHTEEVRRLHREASGQIPLPIGALNVWTRPSSV